MRGFRPDHCAKGRLVWIRRQPRRVARRQGLQRHVTTEERVWAGYRARCFATEETRELEWELEGDGEAEAGAEGKGVAVGDMVGGIGSVLLAEDAESGWLGPGDDDDAS